MSNLFVGKLLSALSPLEKFEAARGMSDRDPNAGALRWIAIVVLFGLILGLVLVFLVSLYRKRRIANTATKALLKYAHQFGLSPREMELVGRIVLIVGVEHEDAVFAESSVFDRGSSLLLEQIRRAGLPDDKVESVKREMMYIKQKIGFGHSKRAAVQVLSKSIRASSREIPVGKSIFLDRRSQDRSNKIEANVVENTDKELRVELEEPVKINFDDIWYVHYYFGACVWEFETTVMSFEGNTIVLKQSDNVRFINRRRFVRVPVNRQAFVAKFPFAEFIADAAGGEGETVWGPPQFYEATVTELAGPGLRIESELKVKEGERVIVVFRLDETHERLEQVEGGEDEPDQQDVKWEPRIAEDVGIVRHMKQIENMYSFAVELIAVDDPAVDELVRATNMASLREKMRKHEAAGATREE